MKKSSPGFTLVELLVTISAAALVLACAVSYVLLGLRMENRSTETASQQQTVRIMLTMAEQMAAEGDIRAIKTVGDSWTVYNDSNQPLLQYLAADGVLRSGSTVLLSDLEDADASLNNKKNLFTLSLKTGGKEYKTSVFCRSGEIAVSKTDTDDIMEQAKEQQLHDFEGTKAGRLAFLNALSQQYASTGDVIGHTRTAEEPWDYFSEWYLHQLGSSYAESPEWSSETPWCACFLSWGAAQAKESLTTVPFFANVDTGMDDFKNASRWHDRIGTGGSVFQPLPGDVVFFSWDGDDNPEHAGAVLYVSGDTVYTIEGNCDDTVAVNSYLIGSEHIVGYGILDWKTTTQNPE